MKTFFLSALFSVLSIGMGSTAHALTEGRESFTLRTDEVMRVTVPLDINGFYTMGVSSRLGDVDIYVYDPDGDRIGVGNRLGDDSISGDIAAGTYTVRVHMAACSSARGTCTAELNVERTGASDIGRPPLDVCVAYNMSTGYDREFAEILCM